MYRRRFFFLVALVLAIAGSVVAVALVGQGSEEASVGGDRVRAESFGVEGDPGAGGEVPPPDFDPLRHGEAAGGAPFVTNVTDAATKAREMTTVRGRQVVSQGDCSRSTVGDVLAVEKARAAEEERAYPAVLESAPANLPVYLCPLVTSPDGKVVALVAGGGAPVDVSFTFLGRAAEGLPGVVFPE